MITFQAPVRRALAALALGTAAAAQATLVFDGGTPDGVDGRNITNYRTADDFTLANAAVLSGIRFWSTSSELSEVSWAIYAPNGGALGGLIGSGSTAVSPVMLGIPPGGTFEISVIDFSIPALAIGAGSYWLELHDGLTLTQQDLTTTGWATTGKVSGAGALQHTIPEPPEHPNPFDSSLAFQLFDAERVAAVPLPATLPLALLGACGIASARRMKRRAAR